jgi:hypothetical protein
VLKNALDDTGAGDGAAESQGDEKERCRGPGTPAVKISGINLDPEEARNWGPKEFF